MGSLPGYSKRSLSVGSAGGSRGKIGGHDIWFSASDIGYERHLRAVTPAGRQRLVARMAGTITLHDISRQGRVLIAHERIRMGTLALPDGETRERELSWLDGTLTMDLSSDGKTVLLSEQASGASQDYGVYLRKTDGSDTIHLGDGLGTALSPDGKWVLTNLRDQLILLPTGVGEPQPISKGVTFFGLSAWLHSTAQFFFQIDKQSSGNHGGVRGAASIGKSTSLSLSASPRAKEPNTRTR